MNNNRQDMRERRAARILEWLDGFENQPGVLGEVAKQLESAPLVVRRLGLTLFLAMQERSEQRATREIGRMVSEWIAEGWGMVEWKEAGTPRELLRKLASEQRTLVSAAEFEAEALLYTAKVIAGALVPTARGG